MTKSKRIYWERKNAGLCVTCKTPTNGTTRCKACAKDVSAASAKAQKKRLDALRARIAELEAMV